MTITGYNYYTTMGTSAEYPTFIREQFAQSKQAKTPQAVATQLYKNEDYNMLNDIFDDIISAQKTAIFTADIVSIAVCCDIDAVDSGEQYPE